MKKLIDLTKVEYEVLKSAGILNNIYSQATGNYEADCKKSNGENFDKVEREDLLK